MIFNWFVLYFFWSSHSICSIFFFNYKRSKTIHIKTPFLLTFISICLQNISIWSKTSIFFNDCQTNKSNRKLSRDNSIRKFNKQISIDIWCFLTLESLLSSIYTSIMFSTTFYLKNIPLIISNAIIHCHCNTIHFEIARRSSSSKDQFFRQVN